MRFLLDRSLTDYRPQGFGVGPNRWLFGPTLRLPPYGDQHTIRRE